MDEPGGIEYRSRTDGIQPPGFPPQADARSCGSFAGGGAEDRHRHEDEEAEPQLAPAVPGLLYKLGTMQAAAHRHEDAVASFRAALQEDPQYGEAAEALAASEAALDRKGTLPESP